MAAPEVRRAAVPGLTVTRRVPAGARVLVALALGLLPAGLASCGREASEVDPRTGVLRARGPLDLAGRPHGEWTWWYPDGEIRERGTLAHGRRHGLWEQWYPEGQRHSSGRRHFDPEARAALREGDWRFWYSTGQLRGIGRFEAGRPEGPWSWWNHQGNLDEERSGLYRAGERVE